MSLRINIPPLTRVLLVLLVGFSLLYLTSFRSRGAARHVAHPELPYIVLVPNVSIFYPWVYITSAFVEQNVITLLIAGATILYGGKYLERAWGSREFGGFLLVVILVPNLVTAFLYVILFVVTRAHSLGYVQLANLETARELNDRIGGVAYTAQSPYKRLSWLRSSNLYRNIQSPY